MANSTLSAAKAAKKDEFYTQYYDIEREVEAYLNYNPDVFRNRTVLLPCDDPEWSNFTKYFAQNFERLGLKKLISTSFAPESKNYKYPVQLSLFETESPQFDANKTNTHGKIFVLTNDKSGDGRIDIEDLEWQYLEGDGDFRSQEVTRLRDEADIIVTNPPFSLFREFWAWIMEADKQFIIIGNMNAVTYKEVFPLIKENKIWLGVHNGSKIYLTPTGETKAMGNTCWFANIEHGRRHQPLTLMSMKDNIKYSKHKEIKGKEYAHYDNYDAIEVPWVDAIPYDYEGIMGVPNSFVDKYCPEQFEILGMCENEDLYKLKTKIYSTNECKEAYYDKFGKKGTYDLNASGVLIVDGIREKVYQRILIRKKQ